MRIRRGTAAATRTPSKGAPWDAVTAPLEEAAKNLAAAAAAAKCLTGGDETERDVALLAEEARDLYHEAVLLRLRARG